MSSLASQPYFSLMRAHEEKYGWLARLSYEVLKTYYYYSVAGFFKSLQQEFVMTGVPVSITIMPLPLILTEKVRESVYTQYCVLEYVTVHA